MEQPAERTRYELYLAGFVLSAAALLAGNLLGYILTSIWGWSNLEYDRPGGVALSALQGAIGVFLASYGSEKFFGSGRFADLWMRLFVWLASGSMVAILILAALAGQNIADVLDWRWASLIANIGAIELTRRNVASETVR